MFVLTSSHRFWWPVTVLVPDDKLAGALDRQRFEIYFEAIGQDEVGELQANIAALPPEEVAAHEHDFIRRVVLDWRDVVNPGGSAVPFTEEVFRQALQQAWFRVGVYGAYREAVNGEAARLGN